VASLLTTVRPAGTAGLAAWAVVAVGVVVVFCLSCGLVVVLVVEEAVVCGLGRGWGATVTERWTGAAGTTRLGIPIPPDPAETAS
jgi:hypothetical protein